MEASRKETRREWGWNQTSIDHALSVIQQFLCLNVAAPHNVFCWRWMLGGHILFLYISIKLEHIVYIYIYTYVYCTHLFPYTIMIFHAFLLWLECTANTWHKKHQTQRAHFFRTKPPWLYAFGDSLTRGVTWLLLGSLWTPWWFRCQWSVTSHGMNVSFSSDGQESVLVWSSPVQNCAKSQIIQVGIVSFSQ